MEKFLKWKVFENIFIFVFFFNIHVSFLITILNPQIPINTKNALILFFSLFFLNLFIFLIPLYFIFKISNGSDLVLIFLFLAVILIYILEKNLHPLFFNPILLKLLKKGLWASFITILGLIFLIKNKKVILLLLIFSAIFLYQRRDSIKFKPPAFSKFELEIKEKPKFYLYYQETKKDENFFQKLKERKEFEELYKLIENGTRGFLKYPSYFKEEILFDSIFTGTYPYLHRNFGKKSNAIFPFFGIDLFPFFYPKVFESKSKKNFPYIWEILDSLKLSYEIRNNLNFEKKEKNFYFILIKGIEEEAKISSFIKEIIHVLNEKDYLLIILPQKGFFFLKGENIKKNYLLTSMKIVDIVPTVLYINSLPLGRYFSGRILIECIKEEFISKNPAGFLGSY